MFTKLIPLLLTDMYRHLTKDASVTPNLKALDRLNLLIDSDYIHNEDVVVDLGALNEGRPSQFEKFWSGLERVLNEYCEPAADSRRHGAATSPLAISVADLQQMVIESFPEEERSDLSSPSISAIRLQFLPKNQRTRSALNFTRRFDVKYQMQTHSLWHSHVDAHYCAVLLSYLKFFSVQYAEHIALFFQDDKHFVSVGEPDLPTATLDRGQRVPMHPLHKAAALDHDSQRPNWYHQSLCAVKFQTHLMVHFFRGKVVVHLKDGVFFPSSALRHSWELDHILKNVLQAPSSISSPRDDTGFSPTIPPILAV